MTDSHYDFIVVGAGSAGCVIANRLVTAGARVLLLEAGGPSDEDVNLRPTGPPSIKDAISDPFRNLSLIFSELDWKSETASQTELNNRKVVISRGKVVGGGSSDGQMVYVRGNHCDFDHWESLGNEGWSYNDVLPYFKKSECFASEQTTDQQKYHGFDGAFHVRPNPDPSSMAKAFVNAGINLGYEFLDDYNGQCQEGGVAYYQENVSPEGIRSSAATAFVDPIQECEDLVLHTNSLVDRIMVEKGRAVGVKYSKDKLQKTVYAEQEVILCAGAIGSPKLLLLSGIGPADHLIEHKIPVNVNLPGVGGNLHDHVVFNMVFGVTNPIPHDIIFAEATLFLKVREVDQSGPVDLQFHFLGAAPIQIHQFVRRGIPNNAFLELF